MSNKRFKKSSSKRKKAQDDFQSILVKASQAHSEGRLADAEKGYLKVLRRRPDLGQVLNALGTVYLDLAKPDKAKRVFEKAAKLHPPNLAACYNLARLLQQNNEHINVLPIYQSILEEQHDNGEVWNNLGVAHRETGNQDEAISCFEKAVEYTPGLAEAWNNLGVARDEANMFDEAVEAYTTAIAIHPDYTSAHFNLGSSLQKANQFKEAEAHYRKVLEVTPDDGPAMFMLESLGVSTATPGAAPAEHVRRIFDQCAATFEKTLVKDLEYKTPELLFNLVRPYLNEEISVLDLGCGTGLGAGYYRPFARDLIGIDISPRMLAKAAEKNIYDNLEIVDILQEWPLERKFDLIYSSDVFVYFGKLDGIIKPISSYLVFGGILAFSVERLEEANIDYLLHSGGRYSHSPQYVKTCLAQHGLQVIKEAESDIRKQSGKPVKGLLIVAKKDK